MSLRQFSSMGERKFEALKAGGSIPSTVIEHLFPAKESSLCCGWYFLGASPHATAPKVPKRKDSSLFALQGFEVHASEAR